MYHYTTLQINGLRGFSCPDRKVPNAAEMHGNALKCRFYCGVVAGLLQGIFFQCRTSAPPIGVHAVEAALRIEQAVGGKDMEEDRKHKT